MEEYNPVSASQEEYERQESIKKSQRDKMDFDMRIAERKGRIAERKESKEEQRKTKAERIAQLKLKIAQRKALQRRLKRDKNITGLVRGLGQAFTPRVKINPAGRLANIRAVISQSENYNAKNSIFKKKDTHKVSFLGRGNVL